MIESPQSMSKDITPVYLQENPSLIQKMFGDYYLEYASYVILERAVPHIIDGLKPVQRRILHSMERMDDGRYNKVANIVGDTMKYHPHGDASIGSALVTLGQKGLLIDPQGNWGNILTGDAAAAGGAGAAQTGRETRAQETDGQTTEISEEIHNISPP